MADIQRLTEQERLFLTFTPPGVRWYSLVAGVCEPPDDAHRPTVEGVVAVMRSRLHFAPERFRQRIVLTPFDLAPPAWVDVPDFDVADHVHAELDERATLADFQQLVAELATAPQDANRPLWDVHLVERLADGRAAFAIRAHHTMLDGAHMLTFAALLAELAPEPEDPPAPQPWTPRPAPTGRELAVAGVRDLGGRVAGALGHGARRAARVRSWRDAATASAQTARAVAGEFGHVRLRPLTPGQALFGRESTGGRSISVHRSTLPGMKAAAKAHGATLNDLAAAVVADALRRLLLERGTPLRPLQMLVPVDVGHLEGDQGDAERVGFMLLTLPIEEADPVARLERIAADSRRERESHQAERVDDLLRHLANASDYIYRLTQHVVQSPRTASLALSNVRGPDFSVWLRGAPVTELYPVLPLGPHHDLAVGLLSFEHDVFLCVIRDPAVAPELDDFDRCLDAAVAAIETDYEPATSQEATHDG